MIRILFLLTCFLYSLNISANTPDIEANVLSENAQEITFEINVKDFSFENVSTSRGDYLIPIIDGAVSQLIEGKPDLPVFSTNFQLDFNEMLKFEVLDYEYSDYPNTPIAPSKGNLLRNIDPNTIAYPFGSDYNLEGFMPENLVDAEETFIFRSVKGQGVKFFPMQFQASSNTLRVINKVLIKAKKVAQKSNITSDNVPAINPIFRDFYAERFLNYSETNSRYDYIDEYGGILYVMPSMYDEVMEPIITWKKQKGHKVFVSHTDDFGVDLDAVKGHISDMYKSEYISYVVIVGDEDQVTSELFLGAGDGYCDNCYGYIDGEDHFPEVLIGRLLVHNADELVPVVQKLMEYETNPNTSKEKWFTTAMGAGSQEGPGDNGEIDFEHMNIIKEELLNFTYEEVYEFYEGNQSDSSPTPGDITSDDPAWPNVTELLAVIEGQGTSLYNYVGHGSHGILVTGGLNNDAIDNMVNDGAYPFCIAVACCVGDFDESDGSGDCFGEKWIKATDETTGNPAGGIGGLFSSVLQSWAPPMAGQDEMNRIIAGTGAYETRHTFGSILVHGGSYMIDQYDGAGEDMMDTWCLFGDPSMDIRTAFPANLEVTHVESVLIGTPSINVSCNTEGAMIGLFYRGESVGTGYVENGVANIMVEGEGLLLPEEVTVTGTAFNTIPYQGQIEVIPAEGPFVILSDYIVNDNGANNNGQADYAELVRFNVTLANVGLESADNVNLVLSTSDANVTLIENNQSFGNIAADDNVLMSESFAIQVADFIDDQHTVNFDATITADGHEWETNMTLKLNAPNLSVGNIRIDDSATGNGNQRMDADETVEIVIENLNKGNSDIVNLTGSLSIDNSFVSLVNGSQGITQLNASTGLMETRYEIYLAANTPNDTQVDLSYLVTDDIYSATGDATFRANLIVEDFENETSEHPSENASDTPWFRTTLAPYAGQYCMQSGAIPNNDETVFSMPLDILEAGTINFSFKTDSENSYDFLLFMIDDVEMGSWSGKNEWEEISYPISAGEHTLQWIYDKDEIVEVGADAVWIDDIILPPYQEIQPSNVEDANLLSTVISPNPAHDVLNLSLVAEIGAKYNVELLNINGKRVKQVLNNHLAVNHTIEHTLYVDDLSSGIYLLRVQKDLKTETYKLVIE